MSLEQSITQLNVNIEKVLAAIAHLGSQGISLAAAAPAETKSAPAAEEAPAQRKRRSSSAKTEAPVASAPASSMFGDDEPDEVNGDLFGDDEPEEVAREVSTEDLRKKARALVGANKANHPKIEKILAAHSVVSLPELKTNEARVAVMVELEKL